MRRIKPMMATLIDSPFDKEGWIFEVKWDGFRSIAQIELGEARLFSRNLNEFKQFNPINETLKKIRHQAILDGEIVILDKNGKSSFQLLQNFQSTGEGNLIYYVFDLIELNGNNLTKLPLRERRELLKKIIPSRSLIKFSESVSEKGVTFFNAAKRHNLEGIIAKDNNSIYEVGKRTKTWLKIKTGLRQEAVIGGYTKGRGSRKYFGSLALGVYEKRKLVFVGLCGGGFDEKTLKLVYDKLKPLAAKKSPFENSPKIPKITWVRPKLICEIKFAEWTDEGLMRQPIFLGLRDDKNPKGVHYER